MHWPLVFAHPYALALLVVVPVFTVAIRRAAHADGAAAPFKALPYTRTLIALLLIMAAAGAAWLQADSGVDVMVVRDQSGSITPAAAQAEADWLQSAYRQERLGDRVGVVDFGKSATVDAGLGEPLGESGRDAGDADATDIEAALRLALASLPRADSRIVLLSDGRQTNGEAESAVAALKRAGVPVDVVPLDSMPAHEVSILRLTMPDHVSPNQPFDASIVIASTDATDADLRLYRDQSPVGYQTVHLEPGLNRFTFGGLREQGGYAVYEARIDAPADTYAQNNRSGATVSTAGSDRILLLADDAQEAAPVAAALRARQLTLDERVASAAPSDLSEWQRYNAVILDDVSALQLSTQQMLTLERYVRDLGGGLITIGGPHAYGLGGYYGTPLETTLPLSMDTPQQLVMPSLAIELVLDRSGSMSESPGGDSKLDLAKQAALGVVDVLHDRDLIGVVAFSSEPEIAVPMQPASERERFAQEIGKLDASGGTSIFPALEAAEAELLKVRAMVKHIVLLTDGRSRQDDYDPLFTRLRREGITLSAVAIGGDADEELLQKLAASGGGRYYYTNDIHQVPQIFAAEALVVSRSLAVEGRFVPQPGVRAEFMSGLTDLPPLYGYVATTAKANASVVLKAQDAPLLAVWRYGLGKAAAFTSSANLPWARDWLAWPGAGAFWSQLVRWGERSQSANGLSGQMTLANGRGRLDVDVLDATGRFVNFLDLSAHIVRPDGTGFDVPLHEDAPGRYSGEFAADAPGMYVAAVTDPARPEFAEPNLIVGSLPYALEYDFFSPAQAVLQRLAAETGGRVLKPDDPIFLSTGGRQAGAPLWPLLLSLAALLFTLDIALRYAPESLLANAAALWRGGLGAGERALGRLRPVRRERAPGDAPPDAEELLRRRKARAREQRRPPGGGPGVGV